MRAARSVLAALRRVGQRRFLANDVSIVDADVPSIVGHRQVTDAHPPHARPGATGPRLVTFDASVRAFATDRGVELLAG